MSTDPCPDHGICPRCEETPMCAQCGGDRAVWECGGDVHCGGCCESCPVCLEGDDDPDPYDRVVFVQGHRHSEPVCAWPDCETYLTRDQMAALPDVGGAA